MLRIDAGAVGTSTASLSDVMNNYVFGYPHAPIKRISITAEGDKVKLKGSVHKIVDVHFEISGGLTSIQDSHPQDAFDFSMDHYNRQLVASYSKNTPRYGLVVFMPDYYEVK